MTDTRLARPVTPAEAANYIEESCRELGEVARRSRLGFLAYLLDVARLEASQTAQMPGRSPSAERRTSVGR